MDRVVAVGADDEGLASTLDHDLGPFRSWLPRPGEVGQFRDVMHVHVAGALAHVVPAVEESADQLLGPSNDAADNIAALTAAVAAIPGTYRRRVLVRLDGAGFSHTLLEHVATGGVKGRTWEFSVGWSCTDREVDAIDTTPKQCWQNAIDQDGGRPEDTWVADITGLLDLSQWTEKIPGLRIIARDAPLHPKYTKRASDREKTRGRRYQLIAVNAATGQVAWLDPRHRCHVHVDDVKQAKAIGMSRGPHATGRSTSPGSPWSPWPGVCWPPSAILARPRRPAHCLGQDPQIQAVRNPRPDHARTAQDPAAPARRLALDPRPGPQLEDDQDPLRYRSDRPGTVLTSRTAASGTWRPAPPTRQSDPALPTETR
jgi:hypothetical protein